MIAQPTKKHINYNLHISRNRKFLYVDYIRVFIKVCRSKKESFTVVYSTEGGMCLWEKPRDVGDPKRFFSKSIYDQFFNSQKIQSFFLKKSIIICQKRSTTACFFTKNYDYTAVCTELQDYRLLFLDHNHQIKLKRLG